MVQKAPTESRLMQVSNGAECFCMGSFNAGQKRCRKLKQEVVYCRSVLVQKVSAVGRAEAFYTIAGLH